MISGELDALFERHGYVRNNGFYLIKPGYENSRETVALFCHHGVGRAACPYMLRAPASVLAYIFFLTTSSVTRILMEKHRPDGRSAVARIIALADTSHLYAGNEPVSSSGLHSPIE